MKLGIDVETKDANRLHARLAALKTTKEITGPFTYWFDQGFSQIHIDTEWNESELDDWLYKTKHGCNYVGTWEIS